MIKFVSCCVVVTIYLQVSERDGEEYAIPTGPFDYVDPMTFNKGPIANDGESNDILAELGLPPLVTRKRKKKKTNGEEENSDDEDSDGDEDSDIPVVKKKASRKPKAPAATVKTRKKVSVKTAVPLEDSKSDANIVMVSIMLESFLNIVR